MQSVRVQHMRAIGPCRYRQLFVPVIQNFLPEIRSAVPHHLIPNGRRRTVGPNHNRRVDRCFRPRPFVANPQRRSTKVRTHAALFKIKADSQCFCCVDQRNIQIRAGNRIDHFAFIFPVRLKRYFSVGRMHPPAFHGYDQVSQIVPQSCFAQRMNPARRNSQINRTPRADSRLPHVRSPLVNVHFESALSERHC